MNVLIKMIEAADASRRIVDGRPHTASIFIEETSVGQVICYRDYRVAGVLKQRHARTNWKLNGKVISSKALASALRCNEVPA